MKIPKLSEAREFLSEAKESNPGDWIQHSIFVGKAAESIADYHPDLDPSKAAILGYLHDIGRRQGITQNRHILDGYKYLMKKGFDEAARICITHSFPIKDIRTLTGEWDCSKEELEFIDTYLSEIEYTDYDRIIQLCDALAQASGYCLIEKRLIDVAIRNGINEYIVPRWQAYLNIQRHFENKLQRSIVPVHGVQSVL